jgi:hypothetical protein
MADFCWPLDRPTITDAAISSNNEVIVVKLNRTVLVDRKYRGWLLIFGL